MKNNLPPMPPKIAALYNRYDTANKTVCNIENLIKYHRVRAHNNLEMMHIDREFGFAVPVPQAWEIYNSCEYHIHRMLQLSVERKEAIAERKEAVEKLNAEIHKCPDTAAIVFPG